MRNRAHVIAGSSLRLGTIVENVDWAPSFLPILGSPPNLANKLSDKLCLRHQRRLAIGRGQGTE